MSESIETILYLGDETKILVALSERVSQKIKQSGIEKINAAEKIFNCVYWFEAEMNNGGFDQYFFNTAGNFALETVLALQEIGANYTAELLQSSFNIFPDKKPSSEQSERQKQLDEIGDASEDFFAELDEKFLAYTDPIGTLLVQYLKKNQDQF